MIQSSNTRRHLRKQSADFLTEKGYPIAASTLAKLACVGGGPVFSLWGRKPIYEESDLLQWAQARCSRAKRSTSDQAGTAP